jgi:DNA repair exonuclease SbcCD nuclease subunit
MNWIWASDLHLKPASSYRKTLLAGDSFYALRQIQEYAIENKVTHIILGGDVCDSNQPPGEVTNFLTEFVAIMNHHKITVLYTEGNHDKVNRNPYLPKQFYSEHRLLSGNGATPLDCVEIDGLVIRGIDYCKGDKLIEALNNLDECDVVCIHAGFRHLLSFDDAYDLTKEDIPDTVKQAVLVGHIHVANSSQTDKGVWIHSSGSTYPWRIDEAQRKHGFLHFFDTMANPKYVELDCRKYYDIDEESDILMTMSEEHALPPVLRYYRDDIPGLDHSEYGNAVKLIPMSRDTEAEAILDAHEENAADLMDALAIGVPKEEYPELYTFLKALLDSQDPKSYVESYVHERGVTLKQVNN